MAYCTASGAAVLRGRISLPRIGAWTAELELDVEEAPAPGKQLQLELPSLGLIGGVRRSGLHNGNARVVIVGGAAGLFRPVEAKSYRVSAASIVLQDILKAAGETAAAATARLMVQTTLPHWIRKQGTAGEALVALIDALDGPPAWRFLPDGTLWVGEESWPATKGSGEVLDTEPSQAKVVLDADSAAFLPGQTFSGEKISYVEHRFMDGRARTHLWLETKA